MSTTAARKGRRKSRWSRLLEESPTASFRRGDAIYRPPEPAETLYRVSRGRVRLDVTLPPGEEVAVGMAGPGELFGKEALIPGRERDYVARAAEETTVVEIPGEEARSALGDAEAGLRTLLEGCLRDVREARSRTAGQVALRVHQRLAALLLDIAHRLGVETDDGPEIPHWLTHQELADLVGANRSTITTILNDWFYEGILADHGRRLTLSDVSRLREMARGG